MKTNRITNEQFQAAQDKMDALTRKTRRGTVGTQEERAAYLATFAAWENEYDLPQVRKVDRDYRDEQLLAVAIAHGLI